MAQPVKRCLKAACGKIVFRPRAAYCLSCSEARRRQLLEVHKHAAKLALKEREDERETENVARIERTLARLHAERKAKRQASWSAR